MSSVAPAGQVPSSSLSLVRPGALLVLVIVITTAFQNYHDLATIMAGGEVSLLMHEGPIVIKLAKDVLIGILFATCVVAGITGRRNVLTDASILCFSLIGLLFVLSWNENGFLIAASGLRWFAPIALFLLLRAKPFSLHLPTAARILFAGVLACFALQIYQLLYMPPFFGLTIFDLTARTPGFFLLPNTTAFYVCVSAAMLLIFEPRTWLQVLGFGVAALSVLLTQSGTGFLVVAALASYAALRGLRLWSLPIAAFLLAVVFFNLSYITGREDLIQLSGGTRVRVLVGDVLPAVLQLDCFGCFTNTAVLVSNKALTAAEGESFVIDSFVSSLIGNLGSLLVPVLACLIYFTLTSCRNVQWRPLVPLLIVYALFSFSTIVTEAFPMNVLLPLVLWATTELRQSAAVG